MDSYIVHIYRRDQDDPELIAGLVEHVQKQERRPFTSLGQLQEILVLKSDYSEADQGNKPRIKVISEDA